MLRSVTALDAGHWNGASDRAGRAHDFRARLRHSSPVTRAMTDPLPPTSLLIKWAEMAARSRLEAALRRWRLSSGQLLMLTTLERLGSASAAGLGRALHLTPQAMTTLLKPIEDRGLIERALDPQNRRRLALSLSPAGAALLADLRPTTLAIDTLVTDALTAPERRQLRTLLARIAAPPTA